MDPSPELRLDPLTLLFASGCLAWMMSAMSYGLSRAAHSRPEHGLVEWAQALAVGGASMMLLLLRGHVPFALSFLLGNLMVLLFPALCVRAFARLFGRPLPVPWLAAGVALGLSGVLGTLWLALPHRVATSSMSFGIAWLLACMAALMVRHYRTRFVPAAWLATAMMVTMVLAFAARGVAMATGQQAQEAVHLATRMQPNIGAMLTTVLFVLGGSMSFFYLVQERQRAEAAERARRDGLTGLYTRTGFFELAERLVRRAPAQTYSVVMVDIDHFKRINDTHGHQGGDVTLAHAARLIANQVRITDVAGRYGGEEFCILLPGCAGEDAERLARRLVNEAARQVVRLPDGRTTGYTLSAGFACRQASADGLTAESLSEVLGRADGALYAAKRGGRNRALAAPANAAPAPAMG